MKTCFHCGGPSQDSQSVCHWCGTAFSSSEVPIFTEAAKEWQTEADVKYTLPGGRWDLLLGTDLTVRITHSNNDLLSLNPLNADEHDKQVLNRIRELAAEQIRVVLRPIGEILDEETAGNADLMRLRVLEYLDQSLRSESLMHKMNLDIAGLNARLTVPMRLRRDRLTVTEIGLTKQAECPVCGQVTSIPAKSSAYKCPQCSASLTYCKHCRRFVTSDRQERICDFCRYHL